MRHTMKLAAAVLSVTATAVAIAAPASAGCQRFGFTVNDYGKDGPTKDAKSLLDKLIASKMAEKGIKKFTTGEKAVTCELFLNFIVFDEHTCTAEATTCWDGAPLPKGETTASVDATAGKPKPDATKKAAVKTDAAKTSALKTTAAKPAEAKAAAPAAPDAAKAAEPAKAADAPAAADTAKPAAQ
jgi:hypothetical protein